MAERASRVWSDHRIGCRRKRDSGVQSPEAGDRRQVARNFPGQKGRSRCGTLSSDFMKPRAIVSAAVLSCAIVSGGWLVQRGLITTGHSASPRVDGSRLFEQVLERVRQDYV